MNVEAVVFIPFTPGSKLQKKLQAADNQFSDMHNMPRLRFVERAGVKPVEDLGTLDPWAGEYYCPRKRWIPFKIRIFLLQEEEQLRERGTKRPKDGRNSSIPGCSNESVNYSLDCITCRNQGLERSYRGETSRSAYQRGIKHDDEVQKGSLDHPLTIHFHEEHGGVP